MWPHVFSIHHSFLLSLSKHLLTVDCILGIIPGTWDSSSRAVWMISPDRISYVTYSFPAPRRRAASWHLLNPGWDPKRDCHLSEVTELMQWQKQNQTSVVSKLSRAVYFSVYKPVPHTNPCCSQCRATAPRLLPRSPSFSPSSHPDFPSCCLSEGRRDLLFSVWKQGGRWMGSKSPEASGVWRGVLKRLENKEERKGGVGTVGGPPLAVW